MIAPENFAVILVTAPDIDLARRLAKAALEAKLIACANIVPAVESHYWLERFIRELHPYDTPEFVALPLTAGSRKYLAWLADSTEER